MFAPLFVLLSGYFIANLDEQQQIGMTMLIVFDYQSNPIMMFNAWGFVPEINYDAETPSDIISKPNDTDHRVQF